MTRRGDKRPSDFVLIGNTKSCIMKMRYQRGVPGKLRAAWEEFYRRYDPLVRRYARNCGVSNEYVSEAVQDAWLAIVKALPSFECNPDRGSFRAWLFVQIKRTVVDQFRHEARSVNLDDEMNIEGFPSCDLEPEREFEIRWDRTVLQQALCHFQKHETEVNFQLFYHRRFCQASIRELSEDSGLPPDVVRQRLHRTGKSFEELLRNYGYLHLMFIVPSDT